MNFRKIALLSLLLVGIVPAAAFALTATFEKLPMPLEVMGGFGVSYDGSRICANLAGQLYLYENDVFTPIAQINGSSGRVKISGDGTAIVGTVNDSLGYSHPAIFREENGWVPEVIEVPEEFQPCDAFLASGYSINHDGTKIVGLTWKNCAGRAYLWTEETGMQDLGPTRASVISDDGSMIGGFTDYMDDRVRRPAYWTVDGTVASAPQVLDNPLDEGEVFDMTSNGSIMVGTAFPVDRPIQDIHGYQAFVYSPGDTNITLLGTLSGSNWDISKATLVMNNGMVFGVSGPSSTNITSFVWTPATGMTDLKQFLIDCGAEGLTPSTVLMWPSDVSSDGSTLVGQWADLYGGLGYYKVTFDTTSPVGEVPVAGSRLNRVHPNPFNPMTTVDFSLDSSLRTKIAVYDLQGRRVAVLADRVFGAGDHSVVWQGHDAAGRQAASGSYVIRMETETGADHRTVTLVK